MLLFREEDKTVLWVSWEKRGRLRTTWQRNASKSNLYTWKDLAHVSRSDALARADESKLRSYCKVQWKKTLDTAVLYSLFLLFDIARTQYDTKLFYLETFCLDSLPPCSLYFLASLSLPLSVFSPFYSWLSISLFGIFRTRKFLCTIRLHVRSFPLRCTRKISAHFEALSPCWYARLHPRISGTPSSPRTFSQDDWGKSFPHLQLIADRNNTAEKSLEHSNEWFLAHLGIFITFVTFLLFYFCVIYSPSIHPRHFSFIIHYRMGFHPRWFYQTFMSRLSCF